MDPLTIAALGSAAGDTIGNPLFAHLTNVKNRKFTREMYKTQRQDALSDWNMVNEYNSPRAMMQRYQEAGLNKNLIYGQLQEAGGVRSSSFSGGQAEAPRVNATEGISKVQGMRVQSAQMDMLGKQMQLTDEEIQLKKAQTLAAIAGSELTTAQKDRALFDLGLETDLRSTTMEGKRAAVDSLKAHTKVALDENERRAALQASTLSQALHNIAKTKAETLKIKTDEKLSKEHIKSEGFKRSEMWYNMDRVQQEINNMKKEGIIKDYEIELNQRGSTKGDWYWWRSLQDLMQKLRERLHKGQPTSKPWQGESQSGGKRHLPSH